MNRPTQTKENKTQKKQRNSGEIWAVNRRLFFKCKFEASFGQYKFWAFHIHEIRTGWPFEK